MKTKTIIVAKLRNGSDKTLEIKEEDNSIIDFVKAVEGSPSGSDFISLNFPSSRNFESFFTENEITELEFTFLLDSENSIVKKAKVLKIKTQYSVSASISDVAYRVEVSKIGIGCDLIENNN